MPAKQASSIIVDASQAGIHDDMRTPISSWNETKIWTVLGRSGSDKVQLYAARSTVCSLC